MLQRQGPTGGGGGASDNQPPVIYTVPEGAPVSEVIFTGLDIIEDEVYTLEFDVTGLNGDTILPLLFINGDNNAADYKGNAFGSSPDVGGYHGGNSALPVCMLMGGSCPSQATIQVHLLAASRTPYWNGQGQTTYSGFTPMTVAASGSLTVPQENITSLRLYFSEDGIAPGSVIKLWKGR